MKEVSYLFIHKDHPISIRGVNSGAEMATLALAKAVARLGCNVVVAAQLRGPEENIDGVTFWDLGEEYDIAAVLKRARTLGRYHLIAACRALPLIHSKNETACLSRHFMAHDPSSGAAGIRPHILSKIVNRIICVSEAQKELFLKEGADVDKIRVIPNGADLEIFKAADPNKRNWKNLLFAGALVADKGLDILINAFSKVKLQHADATLDIFGSSEMWERKPLFNYEEVERSISGIKFHGPVSQEVLAGAYSKAGICVISSRWFDSFPLTAVEAQVTGCPVVGFDVGGVKEALFPGETGVIVPEVSEQALEHCLSELLSNPERLRSMSEKALEKSRQKYSWERVAQEIISLCEKNSALPGEVGSTPGLVTKRLGFLSTWNQQCGLATYAKYLLNNLTEGSYTVLAEDVEPLKGSADEGFVVRCWKRNSDDFAQLEEAIERNEIGLLHLNCHDYNLFPFPTFLRFLGKIRAKGINVVAHQHTTYTLNEKFRAFVSNVDAVIVHTPESRLQVIANGGLSERTWVLPHGVEVRDSLGEGEKAELRRNLQMPSGEKVLTAFGFVQPNKGMEAIVEAVAHLIKCGIPARGYIVGKPSDEHPASREYYFKLHELAAKAGIAHKIIFITEFLSDREVSDYLAASDLVLMNYQSQYYEASGACALALGTGAVVATSTSPVFSGFEDAVWHMTAGFPPGLSAEILLKEKPLREFLSSRAREYCSRNNWRATARKLCGIYAKLGFQPTSIAHTQSVEVNKQMKGNVPGWQMDKLKVLIQNRPNALTQRGGDTVVMEKISAGLRARGVDVTVDLEGREDPARYSILHLFNFALPEVLRSQAERAFQTGVPFVVTTLCEDVPRFHNQSHVLSSHLIQYVKSGQDKQWWQSQKLELNRVPSAKPFENSWVAKHAAALFTNGAEENLTIRRTYSDQASISEIKLGFDLGLSGDAEAFIKEYGVRDFVFCVGRLESRKNQLMLLKALENLDIPVVLAAGNFSYQPDYAEAVKRFSRKGKTLVLEFLSPQMLANAYAAAKVHVLPSWYELPGLVSLEAASYGCNVVVTRNGTGPDYFGDKAFYCDPADEGSILNATMAGFYSPLREGLKEVVTAHTWDSVVDNTLAAYKNILWKKIPLVETRVISGDAYPSENRPIVVNTNTALFDEYLASGEELAKKREFDKAQEWLDKAEGLNANSARLLRVRGAVYLAQSQTDLSKRYFERALEKDQSDPKIHSGLGMCEMMYKHHEDAYQHFVRALQLDGGHLVTILQLLECSYVLNRYGDLERVLKVYVENQPDDLEMQYCHAGALFHLGSLDASEKKVEMILKLRPEHLGSKQLKNAIQEKRDKQRGPEISTERLSDKSLETRILALEIPSFGPATSSKATNGTPIVVPQGLTGSISGPLSLSDSHITERLGILEEEKRKKNFAVVDRECHEILKNPTLSSSQRELAKILLAEAAVLRQSIAVAEKLYGEILSDNPSSARALCGKGTIAGTAGDWQTAETYFKQANELDAKYDVPLAGLGVCACVRREHEKGWEYFIKASERNPENVRALLGIIELGYPLKRLADVEKALRDYLDMHPADLDFIYSLAGCLFAQGKLSEAWGEIDRIFLFNPQHKKALELKGLIEERRAGVSEHSHL